MHCVGGMEMVPRVRKLIDSCKAAKIPVIYTQETHRPSASTWAANLDGNEPDHCLIGSRGVQIHTD